MITQGLQKNATDMFIGKNNIRSISELLPQIKTNIDFFGNEAFIIGNSATLNSLDYDQIKRIDCGYTIGFSSFASFKGLKPRCLFIEPSKFWETEIGRNALTNICFGKDIPAIVFKDVSASNKYISLISPIIDKVERHRLFYTPDVFCPGFNYEVTKQNYLTFFNNLNKSYQPLDFLIRKRASITMALFMCLVCGFKTINFVGCELENSNYFYTDEQDSKIHLTEDSRYGLPVSSVIKAMIDAYNEANPNDKAEIYSYGGRLCKLGIAKEMML